VPSRIRNPFGGGVRPRSAIGLWREKRLQYADVIEPPRVYRSETFSEEIIDSASGRRRWGVDFVHALERIPASWPLTPWELLRKLFFQIWQRVPDPPMFIGPVVIFSMPAKQIAHTQKLIRIPALVSIFFVPTAIVRLV